MENETYKKELEGELEMLTKDLESVGRINPDNPKDWEATEGESAIAHPADPLDSAEENEEYEERTAILKQLEIRFNAVKDALQRIEDGTFGKCEVDGEDIEPERLEVNPAARTCIKHMNDEK